MDSYKEEYNYLLTRYINGCIFLEKNREQVDNYIGELLKILEEMNRLIEVYHIPEKEMMNGFYIEDD